MTQGTQDLKPRWATEPFTMGSREQFARLRGWLASVRYTEEELCTTAGVSTIAHFKALEFGRTPFAKPVDTLSLLVLLFLDGAHIPWTTVESVLPAEGQSALSDLGLLQPAVSDPTNCVGTVSLFPSENILVVSDRLSRMEVIGDGLPDDLVFSPLSAETRRFVALMPREKCEDYLEMCAGTGIAALLAAKQFARHAYSADITERSTRFARFNAALNGLDNFTAVQGDMYEPVKGKMFDVITAHPPYVPAETNEMVFRDGGADGEQITRRVVAGLADHLRPGGLFFLDCVMTARRAEPVERRLRRMLGPAEGEFDVVVVRSAEVEAPIFQAGRLASGRMSAEAFLRQKELFSRSGIERLVDVVALIQRRTTPRAVVTRQRTVSERTRAEDLLWLLRYLVGTAEWGPEENRRLLDNRPRAVEGTELRVLSVLRDGAWSQEGARIGINGPFSAESACPSWFPALLSRCDGRTTAREHIAWLRAEGFMPEETSDDAFAQLLRELADVPYVELDDFPLPHSARGESTGLA